MTPITFICDRPNSLPMRPFEPSLRPIGAIGRWRMQNIIYIPVHIAPACKPMMLPLLDVAYPKVFVNVRNKELWSWCLVWVAANWFAIVCIQRSTLMQLCSGDTNARNGPKNLLTCFIKTFFHIFRAVKQARMNSHRSYEPYSGKTIRNDASYVNLEGPRISKPTVENKGARPDVREKARMLFF